MEKTRGIVMKTSKKCTILYTEYGDYLKIKTPLTTPLLGQVMEVDLPVRKSISPKFLKIASIAAMLLLVLGVSVFNIVSGANTAVAAVVMDINSSKELFVNSDAKVVRVIDLSQGNQTSPSELNLRGKDIYTSIDLILDQAHTQGYFKQSKNLVMASIIPLNNHADTVDQAKLRDSISHLMFEENISADLMVNTTDETTQINAQGLGMSVNNYLVYKRLMDKGFVVTPDGLGTKNTLHMLTEANTTLNSLFPAECMAINPQSETHQEMPSSMGAPMSGKNMPYNGSNKSGSDSSSSHSSSSSSILSQSASHESNKSYPNMANTLPPSNHTMPSSSPKNSANSVPMPKQDTMPVNSGSGVNNMMR